MPLTIASLTTRLKDPETGILAVWQANASSGFSSPLTAPQLASLTAMCDAIAEAVAKAVVDEIKSNAAARVSSTLVDGFYYGTIL